MYCTHPYNFIRIISCIGETIILFYNTSETVEWPISLLKLPIILFQVLLEPKVTTDFAAKEPLEW